MSLSSVWSVAKARPESISLMKLLACLCCQRPPEQPTFCRNCHRPCAQEFVHLMFECVSNDNDLKRRNFMETVKTLSDSLYDVLCTASRLTFLMYLLGKIDEHLINALDVSLYPDFLIHCAKMCNDLLQRWVIFQRHKYTLNLKTWQNCSLTCVNPKTLVSVSFS